jgi:branched-chain amino acid transport system permease protein
VSLQASRRFVLGSPAGQHAAPGGRPAGTATRLGLLVAAVAASAVFPLIFTNQLVLTIGFWTVLFVCAAVAWNLFSGYTGYISLGHAVFFGSGAYVAGILARDLNITTSIELALVPVAGLAAALIAVPFGLVALRVRRHTFVVITIAIFFVFQLLAFNLAITAGTVGLNAPFLLWGPTIYDQRFYWLILILALLTIAVSWLVRGSRFGLQLRAIRDDEDRAASLGVRAMPVKLTAFVISGTITGMAGALWFFFIGQVAPQSGFDPIFDLTVALMAFLGGLGTVSGPILGALIIEPVSQYLTSNIDNSYLSQILLGAGFLLVVLFLPAGLVPTIAGSIKSFVARSRARPPSGSPPRAPAAERQVQGSAAAAKGSAP